MSTATRLESKWQNCVSAHVGVSPNDDRSEADFPEADDSASGGRWSAVLGDIRLWLSDPSCLDDGENPVPSADVLKKAFDLGCWMHKNGLVPPTSVGPIDDTTILFEHVIGDTTELLFVYAEGQPEFVGMTNSQIFLRSRVNWIDAIQCS